MTDIITDAVRAGCGPRCTYPDCICAYAENAAYAARLAAEATEKSETAKRIAAVEAMRERAAQVIQNSISDKIAAIAREEGALWVEPQMRQLAAAIRAIPIEGE